MVSFLDYFPEERTIIFLDEPNRLTEKGGAVEEEYRQSRMHREEKGSRNLPENWLCSFEQLQKELNKRNCISVCALEPKQAGWKVREKFYLEVKSISAYNNSFELLVKDLHQYKKQGYQDRVAFRFPHKGRDGWQRIFRKRDWQPFMDKIMTGRSVRARSWWFMAMQRRALNTR